MHYMLFKLKSGNDVGGQKENIESVFSKCACV